MMTARVNELKREGFKVVQKRKDCTYMALGADHRVVMIDGTMKRGQPEHRGERR
ncbi:MAG: hypothetical protein RBR45_11850 [Pseudomonas sp.]|jgi:hypothetical protein|nr:hypothetical protein [Pseudomonas sp.]